MKKRAFAIALCLLLMCSLAAPAYADIIWEPSREESPFYDAHRDECEYANRTYYVTAGKDGAIFYDAPDGTGKYNVTSGMVVYVQFTWKDWGMVVDAGELNCTWVKLSDLTAMYDYRDFLETHELTEKPENLTWGEIGEQFCLWTYPGSGKYELREVAMLGEGDAAAALEGFIRGYYTDESGMVYGYISYMYGHQDAFVCVSDPSNTDLRVNRNLQQVLPNFSGVPTVTEIPVEKQASYVLPIVLVCGAVVVAGGLLVLLRKKKAN